MKTIPELLEERGQLLARAQALVTLAREEERDFTEDENREYNDITCEGGKIAKIKQQIEQLQRLEALEGEIAARQVREYIPPEFDPSNSKIIIPTSCRIPRNLRAHRTPEDAYVSGQWFLANFCGNASALQWCRDHGLPVKQVLEGGGGGGVLVPDVLENAIIDLKEDYSVFQREAANWPMASDTSIVPRRSSGLTVYFTGETTATTPSDAKYDNVKLIARELSALTVFSVAISEDAVISVAEMLARELAYAIATKIDACGFLGDGTSTYGGIVGLIGAIAAGSTVTAVAGNTSYGELDLADFEGMLGKLPEYPGIMPKWYIHKAGWAASMLNLMNAGGGNTNVTLAGGVQQSFMGYPVVFAQQMNSTLTTQASTDGLCYFGDLQMGALFGDRRGVTIFTSEHRYMEYRQIGMIASNRFDINIHGAGTASAAGPIIMLATPSA